MKVAIIGGGPLGFEALLAFRELDAEVCLFAGKARERGTSRGFEFLANWAEWGGQACDGPWEEVTSKAGRELAGLSFKEGETPNLAQYAREYLFPLQRAVELEESVKPFAAKRVHKRLLAPEESIPGHTRLLDLFRVAYQRPQLEGEDCRDFDLVVDATGPQDRFYPLGASGVWALGEERAAKGGPIAYGQRALQQHWPEIARAKRVAVAGSGAWAAHLLLALAKTESTVILVTPELRPFEKLGQAMPARVARVEEFLKGQKEQQDKQAEHWEESLRAWRELPDYERAKIPRPSSPLPRLEVLWGYSVTAVDRLEDREGLFITCETEDWRRKRGPKLATVQVDWAIAANGCRETNPVFSGLGQGELGFYRLGEKGGFYSLKWGLHQLQWVKEDVLKFFSRV